MCTHCSSLIRELNQKLTQEQIIETLELIKQHNLECWPDNGQVKPLKNAQFLLEHFIEFSKQVTKDS